MITRSFTWLLIIVILSSCYESIEDCLDVDAVNYNVLADDACEDCCELPELTLQFSFLNGDKSLSIDLGDSIKLSEGKYILLEDFYFFLSNIQLLSANGEPLDFEDDIRIFEGEELQLVEHDFAFFNRRNFSRDLEGMRFQGTLTNISYDLGLPAPINFYDIDSLRENTAIQRANDASYRDMDDGFNFFYVKFLNASDSIATEIKIYNDYPLIGDSNIITNPITVEQAISETLGLSFDMEKWLAGIDPESMDESEMMALLKNSFFEAITVK